MLECFTIRAHDVIALRAPRIGFGQHPSTCSIAIELKAVMTGPGGNGFGCGFAFALALG
jgi:hypothetical protein